MVGWVRSVHNARVLSNSAIFRKGINNTLFYGIEALHISGKDLAYPFLPWLMKRYPENINTPRMQ